MWPVSFLLPQAQKMSKKKKHKIRFKIKLSTYFKGQTKSTSKFSTFCRARAKRKSYILFLLL